MVCMRVCVCVSVWGRLVLWARGRGPPVYDLLLFPFWSQSQRHLNMLCSAEQVS